jgi:hypothetical protein
LIAGRGRPDAPGADGKGLYAGEAPLNTIGLQQIDILIPSIASSGSTPALVLTIGGVNTQSSVALAIKYGGLIACGGLAVRQS